MQEEDFNIFDREIRSMLADAEVKPSGRVWRGIASRLDASTRPAPPHPALYYWKWAGASLAMAAVVAAGIFFIGTRRDDIEVVRGERSYMALAGDPATIEAEIKKPTPINYTPKHIAAPKEILPSDSIGQNVPSQSRDETAVPEQGQVDKTVPGQPQKQAGSRKAAKTRGSDSSDSFAQMEQQDRGSGTAKGKSIYAKGAIGGNDSDFNIFRSQAEMAPPSSSSAGTGISELSESTYGVPMSLGLGVRFYILPRLSVGTGLEYSLLTRTFTGKYTKVSDAGAIEMTESGSVSHSLQYIGVPINVYFDLLNSEKIKFYVYGGGAAEYCISNKYTLYSNPDIVYTDPVEKLQYSTGLGLGVEFKIAQHIGLYLDPEVRYYYYNDQPKSVRTDKPLLVNFDAGLRFSF